jgi:hypothetical protein
VAVSAGAAGAVSAVLVSSCEQAASTSAIAVAEAASVKRFMIRIYSLMVLRSGPTPEHRWRDFFRADGRYSHCFQKKSNRKPGVAANNSQP